MSQRPGRPRTSSTSMLVLGVLAVIGLAGPAWAAPRVSLLTMGPGNGMFDAMGHSALRVVDQARGWDRVYTFGALRWTGPLLGWRFLRGEVMFEARVRSWTWVLRHYARADRPIYEHPLRLTPDQAKHLVSRLEHLSRPENRRYLYHHFKDNCATRLRDLVDEATGGALRRALDQLPSDGATARDLVLEGMSIDPLVPMVLDVVLGRPTDVPLGPWEQTFAPMRFMGSMDRLAATHGSLVGPRVTISERRGRLGRLPPWTGSATWLLFGLLVGLLAAHPRGWAWGLGLWGLGSGLLGLVLDTVAMSDYVPEMSHNEHLALFFAGDLALAALALVRRPWAPRLAGIWAGVHGVAALGVMAGMAAGILVQPSWMLAMGQLAASAGVFTGWRRRDSRRRPGTSAGSST